MWLLCLLFHLLMAFVLFPTTRGSIGYGLAGSTLGGIAGIALIGLLKALFHKRVVSALARREESAGDPELKGRPGPEKVE